MPQQTLAPPADGLDYLRGLPCVHSLVDALEAAGFTVSDREVHEAIEAVQDHGAGVVVASVNPWRSEYHHDVEITLHWADHHCVRLSYTLRPITTATA